MEQNPLDRIRSMNELKNKEEEETKKAELEQLSKKQETIDNEYISLGEKKKVLAEDIEKFKKQIEGIKGTREEMIAQYHEAINEAKKNLETLLYVKNNFQEIFKEGIDKWKELRNELNSIKELKIEKTTEFNNTEEQIKEIFPETSKGKEEAENEKIIAEQKERLHKREIERAKENIARLEENIKNAEKQKADFSDILDQKVEYTREHYMSGEAKIISQDAEEFTKLWKQFPCHPFVIGGGIKDCMVDCLEKKKYASKDIEYYKEKREKLKEIQKRIYDSLQKKTARYGDIGFAKSNDISYPSFPYLHIGHGAHSFDDSLLGKQMALGELFDKEIELKTKQLEEAKQNLEN